MILIIFNSSRSQSSVPLKLPPWTEYAKYRFQFPIFPRSPKPLGGPSLQKSKILWKEKTLCTVILPFKMCLAQRLSTILLLRFTFCDGWLVPDFTVALDTSTCSSTEGVCLPSKRKLFSGLLQHTVNNEVFPLARLSLYENLLIRQETIVRCSHSLRSWCFYW